MNKDTQVRLKTLATHRITHYFASLLAHIRFVKKHHAAIRKVAAVADDGIVAVMPALADHFVKADVRHFGYDDMEGAIAWIKQA